MRHHPEKYHHQTFFQLIKKYPIFQCELNHLLKMRLTLFYDKEKINTFTDPINPTNLSKIRFQLSSTLCIHAAKDAATTATERL